MTDSPTPTTSSTPHIRTFAEDLKRAQAGNAQQKSDTPHTVTIPVIPVAKHTPPKEKTRAERLQEELSRHAEPIREQRPSVQAEPLGGSLEQRDGAFDIREAAAAATADGTIVQDRLVTRPQVSEMVISLLRTWWQQTILPLFKDRSDSLDIRMDVAPRAEAPTWDVSDLKPVAPVRTLAHDAETIHEKPTPTQKGQWKRISEPRKTDSIGTTTAEELEQYRAALRSLPKPSAPKETRIPFKTSRPQALPVQPPTPSRTSQETSNARDRLARLATPQPTPETRSREIPFIPPQPTREQQTAPLRTYRYDALSDIKTRKLSARDIAAQEAVRKEQGGQSLQGTRPALQSLRPHRNFLPIAGVAAALLVVIAGGYIGFIQLSAPQETEQIVAGIPAFFAAEHHTPLVFPNERTAFLSTLNEARAASAAESHSATQIYPVREDNGTAVPLPTSEITRVLDPRAPGAFIQTLEETSMWGAYGETRAPFVILRHTSTETAIAGMRAWEPYLSIDLAPFFGTPVRRSFDPNALTVDQTREAFFSSVVVQNHDARVLVDEFGVERIIYAFVGDRVLVTRDRATLSELIARLEE